MAPRRSRPQTDPVETGIEAALDPGTFIHWRDTDEFVSTLREVAVDIERVRVEDPARAVRLYETFLAGCNEKGEEVHDSDGQIGAFVEDLVCDWIRARRASGADPGETAQQVLARMDRDPYGYCARIDRRAVKVLGRPGLAAFVELVSARFEAGLAEDAKGSEARCWGEVLRNLHEARGRAAEYVAVCERTETSPQDCLRIGKLLRLRRRHAEALEWVRRGLVMARSRPPAISTRELEHLERELLQNLGRGEEALRSAWQAYTLAPHAASYEELMRQVPKPGRRTWHEKAMKLVASRTLPVRVELWAQLGEWDLLARHLRRARDPELGAVGSYGAGLAAAGLSRRHPELAARLYRRLAVELVEARKSSRYPAALSALGEARSCYRRAGQEREWETLVADLRVRHRRKAAFVAGLDTITAPDPAAGQPSFLERARRRWQP
jgi:tetratricopeptide (TPR) repeat protein